MKKLFLAVLSLLMVVSLAACGGSDNNGGNETTGPKVMNCNVGFSPDTFDPQASNVLENAIVTNQIYDYLLRENGKGEFEPALAESYTVSEDGTVYTFTLREGLTFEDGSPLTAADVAFSYERGLDPNNAFDYAYQMYYIKNGAAFNAGECAAEDLGLEVVDDRTLVVTLESPTAYFASLTGFNTFGVVSKAYVEGCETYGVDENSTLASGPFKVAEFVKDQYVKFVKNENYWDAANVKLDEVYMYAVTDSSTEVSMYETDKLDFTFMSMGTADSMRFASEGTLKTWSSLNTRYVMVNHQKEVLQNVNVRKALVLALDRKALAENVVTNSVAAGGWIPAGMAAVDDPTKLFREADFLPESGDVAEAQRLLAEAGYPNGEGFPTTLELVYTTSDANKVLAEAIVEMWRQNLGITVIAQNLEGTVRRDRKNTGDYDFSLDGWSTDYLDPYSFFEVFETGNMYNQANYSNTEYDKCLNTAKNSNDQTVRQQAMTEAEKIWMEDMASLPLYVSTKSYLEKDYVTGVVRSLMGQYDMKWADVNK